MIKGNRSISLTGKNFIVKFRMPLLCCFWMFFIILMSKNSYLITALFFFITILAGLILNIIYLKELGLKKDYYFIFAGLAIIAWLRVLFSSNIEINLIGIGFMMIFVSNILLFIINSFFYFFTFQKTEYYFSLFILFLSLLYTVRMLHLFSIAC